MILAPQLRCQAQFAAVHGAELGVKQLVVVGVHQAGGADLRPGREAMLVAAAAQFDSILRSVRRRPDHAVHGQHAQGLLRIDRGAAPGLGQQAEQLGQGVLIQALAGLHAGARRAQRLSIQAQIQLLHHLPQRPIAKQRQSDDQPHGMLGRQLAPPDGGLAAGLKRLRDPGGIYQYAELIESIRHSGKGLAQSAFKQTHQAKKGTC